MILGKSNTIAVVRIRMALSSEGKQFIAAHPKGDCKSRASESTALLDTRDTAYMRVKSQVRDS